VSEYLTIVVVVVVVVFNVGEIRSRVQSRSRAVGSRSGTYDGRSGIAYPVAKLILSYNWQHSHAGAHMEIGPHERKYMVDGRWEGRGGGRGCVRKGFFVCLVCEANFVVEVRILNPFMKVLYP